METKQIYSKKMNDTIAKIKDALEISAVNGGAVIVSTMSQVEQGLRMLSLTIAIVYTTCRLFNLWKESKKDK
ncbi:hypothetical protein [uncultured Mediterranean phage uvMED]|nr:hypothetical protein [uncultured Mediterranean phage uvMED]